MSLHTQPRSPEPTSPMAAPGGQWPTVQLLHTLPDGSHHIDWMLASDIAGRCPLHTFRLPQRIDELAIGEQLLAEAIGEHRAVYLTYEGSVTGDRGQVKRVAAGRIEHLQRWPHLWRLDAIWHRPGAVSLRQRIEIRHDRPGTRQIEVLRADAMPDRDV